MFSTAIIAHSRCYTTFKLRGRNTCYSPRRFRATAVATAKAADETKRAQARVLYRILCIVFITNKPTHAASR